VGRGNSGCARPCEVGLILAMLALMSLFYYCLFVARDFHSHVHHAHLTPTKETSPVRAYVEPDLDLETLIKVKEKINKLTQLVDEAIEEKSQHDEPVLRQLPPPVDPDPTLLSAPGKARRKRNNSPMRKRKVDPFQKQIQSELKKQQRKDEDQGSQGPETGKVVYSQVAKKKLEKDPNLKQRLERDGFNLAGLKCYWDQNAENEVCFFDDMQEVTRCPSVVDIPYLSTAAYDKQGVCTKPNSNEYFCTAGCQFGNEEVKWIGHPIENCKRDGNCPDVPPYVPYDELELEVLSDQPVIYPGNVWNYEKRKLNCPTFDPKKDTAAPELQDLSLGILVRCVDFEKDTIVNTLASYAKYGLLQNVKEVLIYVNSNDGSFDDVLKKYKKSPYNVKILGKGENYGIGTAMTYLVGNSTGKYFMFLEKDWVLIEDMGCWMDQVVSGINLLGTGQVHSVKYRSRRFYGRPLWAIKMFKGKEEQVFRRQKDLLCYVYHWIDQPELVWEQFKVCGPKGDFYCLESQFCGWTNNPNMIRRDWWMENYTPILDKFGEGVWGLEGFMNSNHKQAWHDRNWVIAEGEGMFMHVDRNNFGFI